jgi:hypothetical protein
MRRFRKSKILTLVAGIDIAKETHYARAFDFRK